MCRLLLLPVLAVLALFASATPANADPIEPASVPTGCHVSVPSSVVGARVVLNVVVSASGNITPTGTVTVTVNKAAPVARTARSLAAAPWTTTVRYEGSPLRIVGPRLSRGDHVASIRFQPDPGPFLGCKDTVRFRVGGEVGGEEEAGGGASLPDTGGPAVLWLILGAGLVAMGAELVGSSRRSRA
ncbi:hypothetical protein [Nocardioides sp. WS12]|uniref:hypothetical protein n=1 Tax=Nocardioides sp. WS12 TaxID=2486272 RepID=UPI0015F861A0|nr:hypothetical protein [Nocardioides sp. WS12]